jgi:hypothetical protein
MFKKILVLGVVLFFVAAGVAMAVNEPYLISVQGKLEGYQTPGTVAMQFGISYQPTGQIMVWSGSAITSIPLDENGVFNVLVGEDSPILGVDFNQPLWMSIAAGPDKFNMTEILPRQRITAVPVAFFAHDTLFAEEAHDLRGGIVDATNVDDVTIPAIYGTTATSATNTNSASAIVGELLYLSQDKAGVRGSAKGTGKNISGVRGEANPTIVYFDKSWAAAGYFESELK